MSTPALLTAFALLVALIRTGNALARIERELAAIRRHSEARELRDLALFGPPTDLLTTKDPNR